MTKLSVKIVLVLIGVACAALVVSIISPEWFVVSTTTTVSTTVTSQADLKFCIIGTTLTERSVITGGVNVTSDAVSVDYWRGKCSGACSTYYPTTVPSCNDLHILHTTQTDFMFDSVCTMPKVVLSFVVVGMFLCLVTGSLIFWTIVYNGPIIFAAMASGGALVCGLISIIVYGAGVIDKASVDTLGLAAVTTYTWQAGYGYGICIAATALLVITTIMLVVMRQSAFDDNEELVSSARTTAIMSPLAGGGVGTAGTGMMVARSPLASPPGSGFGSPPHRQPFVGASTTLGRPPPLNWQMQAQQNRSQVQQMQWKARV